VPQRPNAPVPNSPLTTIKRGQIFTSTCTNHPESDGSPSWSPDGRKIAFVSNRRGGDLENIYVMNANGTNPVNLTNHLGFDDSPSWSPDGRKIAFRSFFRERPGGSKIYVINSDGTNLVKLTNHWASEEEPFWFPANLFVASPRRELPTLWGTIKRHQ